MADAKISALTNLTAADPTNDMIPIVDVSDTPPASGNTKRISINNLLACSPSATLASATITGALTVDTTTLVVDAANDMVGVGTAPIYKFHAVATSGAIGAFRASTAAIARLLVGNTVGDLEIKVNANSDGQITSDVGKYLGLGSNTSNDRVILDTSGNLSITNGNVVMATSGKGIDFSATASGSGTMTSELLHDYEEGTWQGTLTGGTTTPGSPLQATGKYTKIGRQVSITIYFQNVNTTGYAGAVSITGLPFTEDGSRANGTAACYNFDFNSGTCVFVNVGVATLYFTSMLTNSNWRDVNHSAGAGRYLQANVVYYV